jgi:hypothetical protein
MVRGILGLWQAIRGLAVLARCVRLSPVYLRAEPASGGGIAEAMEVPFCLVEFRAGRKRYLRWLFGDGKTRGQLGTCGAVYRLPLWRMGRCVLPSLSAKMRIAVLPGRGRAGAPGRGPVERLEFAAAESSREHLGEERPLPVVALGNEFLQFRVRVGDGSLAKFG